MVYLYARDANDIWTKTKLSMDTDMTAEGFCYCFYPDELFVIDMTMLKENAIAKKQQ